MTPEDQGAPRGLGFWKFNNSLLENEEFVTKLKFLIQNAKEKYKEVTDKRLFWEIIKMEIRIFSIQFAKRKVKEKRDMKFELLRKLQDLNARIDATPEGNPLANEPKKIEIKLDQMASKEKTRGCIVRSRARWYESGEKCNKYFLNLSKRSYNKRHIKKLKSSAGSTIEDSKTILNEMKNYYQQLYTYQFWTFTKTRRCLTKPL